MDLSIQDLDDYTEKIENIFANLKTGKKNNKVLVTLVESISSELEIVKSNEKILQDNLKKFVESENINTNRKCFNLEEECINLEKELKLLKIEKDQKIAQVQNELETQKNEFLAKIKNIEEKSQADLKNLKTQLQNEKLCYEAKVRDLYNENQMHLAANELAWDEKESELKTQLKNTKNSLQHSENTVRNLQYEVSHLRNQLAAQQYCPPQTNIVYVNENPHQQIKHQVNDDQYFGEFINENDYKYFTDNEMTTSTGNNVLPSQPMHTVNDNSIQELQSFRSEDQNFYIKNQPPNDFSSSNIIIQKQEQMQNMPYLKPFNEEEEFPYERKSLGSFSGSSSKVVADQCISNNQLTQTPSAPPHNMNKKFPTNNIQNTSSVQSHNLPHSFRTENKPSNYSYYVTREQHKPESPIEKLNKQTFHFKQEILKEGRPSSTASTVVIKSNKQNVPRTELLNMKQDPPVGRLENSYSPASVKMEGKFIPLNQIPNVSKNDRVEINQKPSSILKNYQPLIQESNVTNSNRYIQGTAPVVHKGRNTRASKNLPPLRPVTTVNIVNTFSNVAKNVSNSSTRNVTNNSKTNFNHRSNSDENNKSRAKKRKLYDPNNI